MAVLYISEFSRVYAAGEQSASFAVQPPIAEQTVAIGAGSVASASFNAATTFVRLHTDAICSIEFGAAPTATATKARMAAGTTEYFAVAANSNQKVAVITNS
jgi:hypothetical protein